MNRQDYVHPTSIIYGAGSGCVTCSRRKELEGTDSGAETDNTAPPKPARTADADSAEVEASLDVARIPPWATCVCGGVENHLKQSQY